MPEKSKAEPTSAQIELAKYEDAAAQIGTPDPIVERSAPKPDKRDAIQIERDEQARVEKSIHNITLVEGKA